jgi:hypothetical protein
VPRNDYIPTYGDSYELSVELRGIRPKIWRNLQVPLSYSLDEVSDVIQIAFGWENSHLHDFEVNGIRFGMSDVEDEIFAVDECGAPLGAIATLGSTFLYRYDFGDDWEHDVKVSGVVEYDGRKLTCPTALCTGGARACPPEDCGGPHGYTRMLEVLADRNHSEYKDVKSWIGRSFDPEKFNIAAINKKITSLSKRIEKERKP